MINRERLIKEEPNEVAIYDSAVIYRRGEFWQFKMWLSAENKYARKSLRTKNRMIAIEKGKENYHEIMANMKLGKTYFSLTAKEGVEKYLASKEKEIGTNIKKGRYGTIKTHLEHWLNFIKRDTKLKDLHRMMCEDYYLERNKNKKKAPVKTITLKQEMSTINTMMKWLHNHNETLIDEFEFKKLKRIDRKDETLRRNTFYPYEVEAIERCLGDYCDKEKHRLEQKEWLTRLCVSYYLMIASLTGLRTGEQKQLRWSDLLFIVNNPEENQASKVNITVRAETSKVGTSRNFFCLDKGYFEGWQKIIRKHVPTMSGKDALNSLVFSLDGKTELSQRATLYHFGKILDLAKINRAPDDSGIKRHLVPYSFRHFFITQKINAGLGFHKIADMCGTSTTQIENTYRHPDEDEKRMADAMVGYEVDEDGNVRFQS